MAKLHGYKRGTRKRIARGFFFFIIKDENIRHRRPIGAQVIYSVRSSRGIPRRSPGAQDEN